jgi:hypothetical protein
MALERARSCEFSLAASSLARYYPLWETITHLVIAETLRATLNITSHVLRGDETTRATRRHRRRRRSNDPQRVHGRYCARRTLIRNATRHDRSRRLPSAHEALAVVDRPTNNALISSFLRVFPFLLSFATQPVHFPLSLLFLSLSLSPSRRLLLLLLLLLFTTFSRPKVERSPERSESRPTTRYAYAVVHV